MPVPTALHSTPFHFAIRIAGMPPAVWKFPPA